MSRDDAFYTLQEVADKLKVSYQTVYRWVHSGQLVGHKFGTEWRIKAEDLEEFIERHRA